MLRVLLITFLIASTVSASPRISVQAIGFTDAERKEVVKKVLTDPDVLTYLREDNYRIISTEINEDDISYPKYSIFIYNYAVNKMFEITGTTSFLQKPRIKVVKDDHEATPEEFEAAVEIIKNHSDFVSLFRDAGLTPYDPMPSVIPNASSLTGLDGTRRLIAVGLNSTTAPDRNEIVGVDLSQNTVVRFPQRAPPTSLATRAVCGPPSSGQATTPRGTSGSAAIEIKRDDEVLWKLTVVRPSVSSGSKGSGLELRNVYYKGKLVLTRAHTPIVNVQYAQNKCGPYRDWSYSENSFVAHGTDKAPGIRIATSKPSTIFDTENDRGNFRGVAIYDSGSKVLLVTEISAGWYRYASQFELHDDGTIRPFFQFSAVSNSCVCYSHNHHVYWRFDFDINGSNNNLEIENGSSFRVVDKERSAKRTSSSNEWRVLNEDKSYGYLIKPGGSDGFADSYSIADAWALKYSSSQIDDGSVRTSTRAALDKFINGASLINTNIVLWYTGHFVHDHDDRSDRGPGVVGPVLSPIEMNED